MQVPVDQPLEGGSELSEETCSACLGVADGFRASGLRDLDRLLQKSNGLRAIAVVEVSHRLIGKDDVAIERRGGLIAKQ